jgi:hypothetical protein
MVINDEPRKYRVITKRYTGFSKEDDWILKRGIALALHIKVTQ